MLTTYQGAAVAEWTKIRSLRSTWWTLAAMVGSSIALAAITCGVVAAHWATATAADKAGWDPTNQSLSGTLTAQIAIAVLGVLAITAEFSTGTIRASVMATPHRTPLTVAKAVVVGFIALVVGEIGAFGSFFVGQAILSGHAPSASIGQPGVLRAVVLCGVYCALVALVALGLGLILRHTAGAISAIVGIFLVLPGVIALLPGKLAADINRLTPEQLGANSMGAVVHVPDAFSALTATVLMAAYAVAIVAVGNLLLRRRDV